MLADGTCFEGYVTGSGELPLWGEVVFNTSMTGYQEVITDPSYAGQIVVMTYPEIGNYGVHEEDNERERIAARALVVHELSTFFSPAPGRRALEDFMRENGLGGLTGIDTRAVALRIREDGAVMGVIGGEEHAAQELAEIARSRQAERDLVAAVSRTRREHKSGDAGRVAVIDFGAKKSIVDAVARTGADTVVFPSSFSCGEVLGGGFDAVVLSNGPGDPTDVPRAVDEVSNLVGHVPLLGVCLGHQVIALAMGGRTFKLKFGHRGANQPVVCQRTGRVFVTAQNHGYAVADDLPATVPGTTITYTNANDGTVEGFAHEAHRVECVQYHPEAAPGPHDTSFVFSDFFNRAKGNANAGS